MSYQEHLKSSDAMVVRCVIITLSDTRTIETDTSGKKIAQLLAGASLPVMDHQILPDDAEGLELALQQLLRRDEIDVILTTGGTGISRRDRTIAVIEKIFDDTLPGFGELFRSLSYQQIGSSAMLSRATAGISRGKLIFAMPGSTAAVELAMTQLILPQIKHLLHQLRK